MDLSQLTYDVNTPFDFVVADPVTEKPTDFVVSLLSIDSDAVREASLRLQNQLIAKQGLLSKRSRRGSEELPSLSAEDMEDAKLQTVLAGIVGWRGLKDKGQEIAFSTTAAAKLFSNPALRRVVDEMADAIGQPHDFLAKPKPGTAS